MDDMTAADADVVDVGLVLSGSDNFRDPIGVSPLQIQVCRQPVFCRISALVLVTEPARAFGNAHIDTLLGDETWLR